MSEAVVVGGRRFEPSVLRLIRKWVKESPELSRAALSRKVCEQLNWRAENGRLQEMSCRVALVRLDERGVIELPAARNARGGLRKTDRWRAPPDAALYCTVAELGKIRLVAVNTPALSELWNLWIAGYHYVGFRPLVGRHRILTRRTYMGEHEFNKRSKSKELKPVSEIVVVPVPPIIDRETFDAVQALLKARHPTVTPSAVISGPTLLTGLIHCAKCGGAMTIRTGKGGRYRYYACSMKARQGPTACEGMAVPMDKLDDLVASHLEERLLQLERLETILAAVLDRREEHAERRREHIGELNKRAAESELRLKRLYDAIEAGVADLDDPALKDRIDGLKAIRDQAKADAERAQAMLQNSGSQAVTPQMLAKFARTARQRIRLEGGGYRRDHLRALAQRVEVAEGEVRIMGSKSRLLQTLVANGGVNSVPTQGLKWRRERTRLRTLSAEACAT